MVSARTDGRNDLLGLGRRKDELDVRRRLFNELEQCVETLRGDHVGLIQDEDLVAVAGRGKDCALAQFAGVVDTIVAGGVNLNYV